ncbi:MAG TPA: class I SAM-dependent methyltransferase [Gaiellaceae bacterium]|jgi:SAM-dependent methyltransferase|nr:class I SAM-dependent methyltransferase [Gaiellaceae bacterium]
MFSSDLGYDKFMGRFSTRLAPVFADFAGIERGKRVLDVGAGTGALTAELVRRDVDVAAVEPSPEFTATLQSRFPDIEARQGAAEDLPWPDASFDAALAQLVVAFMSDAPVGIAEMRRVVRPGGTVAVCMWLRDDMELLSAINRTQAVISPERSADVSPYRSAEAARGLLGDDARVEMLTVSAEYSGFDDFWSALGSGAGPAGQWALSLSDEQRAAAHDELYRQVGEPAGSFTLSGTAWAARVTRG